MSQVPSFIFGCPGCQKEFKVLAEFAGEVVQCPHCGQKMRIPATFFDHLADTFDSEKKLEEKTKKRSVSATANKGSETSSKAVQEVANQGPDPQNTEKIPVSADQPKPVSLVDEINRATAAAMEKREVKRPAVEKNKGDTIAREADSIAVTENPVRSSDPGQLRLPPTFSTGLQSRPAAEKARTIDSVHPDLPPVFLAGVDESEPPVAASLKTEVTDNAKEVGGNDQQCELDSAIAARLPPRFEAEDPTKIRTSRDAGTKVFLPTAEGGIQTVDQRTVTVEYQGEKYVLIAMSPEEKRRRTIISNLISILIAILAIALTLWLLN